MLLYFCNICHRQTKPTRIYGIANFGNDYLGLSSEEGNWGGKKPADCKKHICADCLAQLGFTPEAIKQKEAERKEAEQK